MSPALLEGIRVIDMSQIRAGPKAARWLADAGAEVIKVEHLKRPDGRPRPPAGGGPIPEAQQREHSRSGGLGVEQLHRNKLGLSLDLSVDEGRGVFLRLVAASDVIIENFSAGVMDRLGLGYSELSRFRPGLVMISMPAFGSTGPQRDFVGYGWALEHLSGVSALTGYQGGGPLRTGTITPDPLNGIHAAGAVMAGLVQRARTGKGCLIELSHWESMISLVGAWVLDYSFNSRTGSRLGNRHPIHAPQGCYPCLGDDAWIVLSVTSEEEWQALCRIIGAPELVSDPRFATRLARQQNHDTLDGIISEWSMGRLKKEAMQALQEAGVPAGAVLDNAEALDNEHILTRGFVTRLTHPDGVTFPYMVGPWRFSKQPVSVRTPAPLLGEHNDYVLGRVLDMTAEEIRRLQESGIIATLSSPMNQLLTRSQGPLVQEPN